MKVSINRFSFYLPSCLLKLSIGKKYLKINKPVYKLLKQYKKNNGSFTLLEVISEEIYLKIRF